MKGSTENISITLPASLLEMLDAMCAEADLNRSQAVGRAVRLYLASKLTKDLSFWDREYQRLQAEGKL